MKKTKYNSTVYNIFYVYVYNDDAESFVCKLEV